VAITAKRYTPYTEVEFHTAKELYAVSRGGGWDNIQPTRDLISVQTNKQLSAPMGTWQVMLTGARGGDGMDWYDRLQTNDLVVIKMGRPPEMMGTPMVGLIDEVRRTKGVGADGSPERRVLVRGSDFGKVLAKAMLRFYPSLASTDGLTQEQGDFFKTGAGWQAMLNFFVGSDLIQGKPAEMIRQAIVKILYRIMNISYKYWDSAAGERDIHLANILRYRLADSKNIIPFLLTMLDYEGAFWNFIERVSIKPFNELFIDTRGVQPDEEQAGKKPEYMTMVPNTVGESYYPDGDPLAQFLAENDIDTNPNWSATFGEDGAKVILYLRNTPFEYEDWNNLYTHDLDYDEIISEDLGRSDHENYNVFMVTNSLAIPSSNNLKLLVHPVIDEENARRYGMSPLEVSLEGVSIEDEDLNAGIEASKALSQKLYDWYRLNKDYKTGAISIKGNAFIKVGQRLIIRYCEYNSETFKFDDLVFYIEGVTQNFTSMDSWQTSVTLTRGQRSTTLKPRSVSKPVLAAPLSPAEPQVKREVPNSKTYTVQSGDTLWAIASNFYGSGEAWRKIWNANSEALIARDERNKTSPGGYLYAGQSLIIPD
jgi:LysM repeat protein